MKVNNFQGGFNHMKKRMMSMLLVFCMVFTLMPQTAFATGSNPTVGLSGIADSGNLTACENHPEHTDQCGYAEGHPCEHSEHGADCYTDELICGYDEEEQLATDSDALHTHTQECYELDCPHERGEHDDDCGYTEAVPCGHVCDECGGGAPEEPENGTGTPGEPENGTNEPGEPESGSLITAFAKPSQTATVRPPKSRWTGRTTMITTATPPATTASPDRWMPPIPWRLA